MSDPVSRHASESEYEPSARSPHVDFASLRGGDVVAQATLRFTRADLVRYAGASTDFNPIHYSDAFATGIGLPGVVAHGMLTMGAALRVVTDWVQDPARIRSYRTKFVRPVPVPEGDQGASIEVRACVIEVVEAVATLSLEVTHHGEKVLGVGRVEVDLG